MRGDFSPCYYRLLLERRMKVKPAESCNSIPLPELFCFSGHPEMTSPILRDGGGKNMLNRGEKVLIWVREVEEVKEGSKSGKTSDVIYG